jgi:purine-binding chemotaxis protein CheW
MNEGVAMEEMNTINRLSLEGSADISLNARQYLTFHIGNEIYGVEVNNVREVIEYEHVYKIPTVPSFIRGVINLRGEVVPVVDLSSRFYKRASDITKLSCIVIVEVEDRDDTIMLGFVIDSINAVIDIPEEKIETTPGFGARIRTEFISGIGKIDSNFIILLNMHKVLDISELSNFGYNLME